MGKVVLITQARIGSKRLPEKVMLKIQNKTLLQIHLDRLIKCKNISEIIVATTINLNDKIIVDFCQEHNFQYFRGSENDVLDRYYNAVKDLNFDYIVRVTSDCPLIDSILVDKVIQSVIDSGVDYGSNTMINTFPDGQDVEVFKFSALEKAWKESTLSSDREHVTPYIWRNTDLKGGDIFKAFSYQNDISRGELRMTVDETRDFDLIKKLIEDLGENMKWNEYADYIEKENLMKINEGIQRNEGYIKSLNLD